MASLRKMGKCWYARVSLWDGYYQKEKLISLKTSSSTIALERKLIVNKHEKYIKEGIKIDFPWQSKTNKIEIKKYILIEGINDYINNRKMAGIRPKTISIYDTALSHFISTVGANTPLKTLNIDHIDEFIRYFSTVQIHSKTTININLRAIKSFFIWSKKRGLIDKTPIIEQLLIDDSEPLYINDGQFEQILNIHWLPTICKEAFIFFRETGCRLREPFFAKIYNNWIEIPKEYSKNRKARHILLDDELIIILRKLKNHYSENPTDDRIKYFSKQFQKALKHLNIKGKKFHSLRHTFCIRRIIQTNGNIFQVRDEMGHKSVTTTERYAKLDIKRLQNDFPTLFKSDKKYAKMPIMDKISMDIINTNRGFIDDKLN